MKKFYLSMLVLALFSFNQSFAQECPPTGFADNADQLFFVYSPGTSNCVDRPNTVFVEGSTFTLSFCDDALSIYNLTSGPSLSDPNSISVDFGFSTCEYSGGTLSAEDFEMILKSMLTVYPNPIAQGNELNIKLGINTSVKINIFSVTGKRVLTTGADNLKNLTVDVSSLENGIYMLQIATDLATITRKVIVMK